MNKDIAAIRSDYHKMSLDPKHIDPDPIVQFKTWLDQALESNVEEPTAMTLSTVSEKGHPTSRVILLKGMEHGAFIFYSNYLSTKGRQLNSNPQGALTFFWPELERQVNITGVVEHTSKQNSDSYFASRPRRYQLGAWASNQSQELPSRFTLIKRYLGLKLKYLNTTIPRPPFWGGYQLIPETIEFWQGRPSRLHDRILYRRDHNGHWTIQRLSP